MIQSDKKVVQDLVQLSVEHGVRKVIITPGSRNAPLAISFQSHPEIQCLSIADERSAGFFALGLSLSVSEPVAICCTSGTALLNYYPAVTEAFYQRQSLIVLSADRPPERIDQQDGQTIRQASALDQHVRKSVNLTLDHDDPKWISYNSRLINEALIGTRFPIPGPVHINIPLREPLYETLKLESPGEKKSIQLLSGVSTLNEEQWEEIHRIWNHSPKIMILLGMDTLDEKRSQALAQFDDFGQVVIMQETTSNSRRKGDIHIDRVLGSMSKEEFQELSPDLVITTGGGLITKRLKQWLREVPGLHHWHINEGGEVMDTFQTLSLVIDMPAGKFLLELSQKALKIHSLYKIQWAEKELKTSYLHQEFLNTCPFSDLKVFSLIEQASQKETYDLHIGNSSAIRYLQLFDFSQVRYHHCNRGTSGIDGTSSTAVGFAYGTQELTLFITGDISFFYDVNAWWNEYVSPRLRIILINNGGGNIFRLIDGPGKGGALDPFQETPHTLSAEGICRTFNLSYSFVDNERDLKTVLGDFFNTSDQPRLLEVKTPRLENPIIWKAYFNYLTHGNNT